MGLALALTLVLAGCPDGADDKIEGWPRPGWRAERAPVQPVEVDAEPGASAAATRPQVAASARDAEGSSTRQPRDAGPSTADADPEAEVSAPKPGCARLVARACELHGLHSDGCNDARMQLPARLALTEHAACEAVLQAWELSEEPDLRRQKACWWLSREVCRAVGDKTPRCQDAKANATRLRQPEQKDGCSAELLLFRVRHILTSR